jgi:hypothetical protein
METSKVHVRRPGGDDGDEIIEDGGRVTVPPMLMDGRPVDVSTLDARHQSYLEWKHDRLPNAYKRNRGVRRVREQPWLTMAGGKRNYKPGLPGRDGDGDVRTADVRPPFDAAAAEREANAAWAARNRALSEAYKHKQRA